MCAPIEGIKPRIITPREFVDRFTAPLVESPFTIAPTDTPTHQRTAEPPPPASPRLPLSESSCFVEAAALDHFAELHRYGRKPHAEIITGLLDNYYTDGNQAHLDQALTFLEHLRTLSNS
jgi:hypothetical protein